MIAVLLLGVLLVLGILGLVVYLLFFRSAPPPQAGEPRPAPTAPPSSATSAPRPGGTSTPGPGAPPPSRTGQNTGELEAVARDYVDAVNDQNKVAATALTCGRADPGTLYSVTGGRDVRLGAVELIEGSVGSARVSVGDGEAELLFEKQEDGWCVAI